MTTTETAPTGSATTPERSTETPKIDVGRVFGESWAGFSEATKKRIESASPESDPVLFAKLQRADKMNVGKVSVDVPASLERGANDDFVMNLRHRALAFWMGRPSALVGRTWGKIMRNKDAEAIAKNRSKPNPGESDAEYYARMKGHARTTLAMGTIAILGGLSGGAAAAGWAGTAIGLKVAAAGASVGNAIYQGRRKDGMANHGAGVFGSVGGGVAGYSAIADAHGMFSSSNATASQEVSLASNELLHNAEGSPDGDSSLVVEGEPNRVRGAEEYTHSSYNDAPVDSPEAVAEVALASRTEELAFLNENGRHNNDFNNITPEELNDPANEGHFPGYTALMEQYNESPQELAAQLFQIYEIESANGHTFDALPPELRDLAGGNGEAFIEALAEAMYADPELHDTLTAATLDYIQEHAGPLTDLSGAYEANYLVLEDGKPVVKLDDYVESASDEDTVIMLSETKGIRFPCGQPIEIIPQPEYVAQAVSPQPVVETQTHNPPTETIPQNPVTPVTPVTPETPVTPVTPNPEPETPVVVPESKDERQNFDHNTPDFFKAGEQVGSGAFQPTESVVRPSEAFTPGNLTPDNDNSPAPGATTPSGSGGPSFGGGQDREAGSGDASSNSSSVSE